MQRSGNEKSVLLLGATGLVGRACLNLLLADARFSPVVTLTRRPLPEAVAHPNHTGHVIDFDDPDSYRDKMGADIVICALGTTIKKAGTREDFRRVDFDYAFNLSKTAFQKGARHLLLVSAKGAAAESRFFYNRVKGELEEAISGLGFERLSIFRPSLLKGARDEFRIGEEIGNFAAGVIGFGLPANWKPTPVKRLAEAIIAVAKDVPPGGRVYESGEILAFSVENR